MAKRVNKRFLIALTACAAAVCVVAFASYYLFNKKDPAKYLRLGDDAVARVDWAQARDHYRVAAQVERSNKETWVKYGDALERLAGEDLENLRGEQGARNVWRMALQIDPNYLPALQRLSDSWWEEARLVPHPNVLAQARDYANRHAAADPDNLQAQARPHMAVIQQWIVGAPLAPGEADKAVAALAELAKHPDIDPDVPLYVAQAKLLQMRDQLRTPRGRQESDDKLVEVAALMEQAVARQPRSAAAQFRAYQVFASVDQLRGGGPATRQAGASAGAPADRKYLRMANDALDAALKLVQAGDKDEVEIWAAAAARAQRDGKPDEARRIQQELLDRRPDDQRVRLMYARAFGPDPAHRDAVITLLGKPVAGGPETDPGRGVPGREGHKALERLQHEAATIYERTNLQIAAAGGKGAQEQKQLLAEIRGSVKRLESLGAYRTDHPHLLNLKSSLALLEGNLADAIELLEQAVRQLRPTEPEYYDLKYRLASYHFRIGHLPPARDHLGDVLERLPGSAAARRLMVQLLLASNEFEAAAGHLEELRKIDPKAEDLPNLELAIRRQKAGASPEDAARLPEGTRDEKLVKAQSLAGHRKLEQAEKLLESVLAEDPKDLAAVEVLTNLLVAAGEPDKATDVVKRALEANPGNNRLEQALVLLQKRAPQELYEYQRQQAQAEQDPLRRELALYNLERGQNNLAQAEKHLRAAEQRDANHLSVLVALFDWTTAKGQWDEAAKVVERLAKADADAVGGNLYRFRLAAARGDWPAAEAAAREMTRLHPVFAQGWASLGQALHAQEKYREAAENYRHAVNRQDRHYDALRGLIACQYALNAPEEARAAIDQARRLFPHDRTFRDMLLNHELEYGDAERAVAERERLLRESPDQPDTVLAAAVTALRTADRKYLGGDAGGAKRAAELKAKARDVLAEGVKKWPGDVRMVAALAEVLQSIGGPANDEAARKLVEEFAARPEQQGKPTAHLLRSDYFLRAKQVDQAEKELRAALAASDTPEMRQRLVTFLAQHGKQADALALLDRTTPPAATAQGVDPRLLRQRVQLLLATGKHADAERAVGDALAKSPDLLDLLNLKTAVMLEAGRADEALAHADQVLRDKRFENDDLALHYRGLARMRRQPPDFGGAVQDLALAASRAPRNVAFLTALADAYRLSGQTADAIVEQQKALRLAPLDKRVRARLIDLYAAAGRPQDVLKLANEAKAHPQLNDEWVWDRASAVVFASAGNYPEALKRIGQAMALAPAESRPSLTRDQLDILLKAKDYDGALKLTDQLIADGTKDWWVYQYRGLARAGKKDTRGAVAEFEQALSSIDPAKDPAAAQAAVKSMAAADPAGPAAAVRRITPWFESDPAWRLLAVQMYRDAGDSASAIAAIESLLADADRLNLPKPTRAEALRLAGELYVTAKPAPLTEKAVDAFSKLVELVPTDWQALNNVAYLLAEEVNPPRPKEAKRFSERAYAIAAKQPRASQTSGLIRDTHGWVLVLTGERGDMERGIELLREVVDDTRDAPILEAHYHLGEAYLRRPQPDAALAQDQLRIALNLIEQTKKAGGAVDSQLEARVRAAAEKAQQMMQAGAR